MEEMATQAQLYRNGIISYVYRLTGSFEEAQDIAQETALKYISTNSQEILNPKAWMFRVATNLSWDFLKSAKTKRESYIGPWLPEPFIEDSFAVEDELELDESLSMALLIVMEKLSSKEKISYLLYDIFSFSHNEIATILNTSEQNSRKLSSRANRKLKSHKNKFSPTKNEHEELTNSFLKAIKKGNFEDLKKIFSDEVTLCSDGGGKAVAYKKVLHGDSAKITKFLINVVSREFLIENNDLSIKMAWFNGSPGFIVLQKEKVITSFNFEVINNKISSVFILRNPDKLKFFYNLMDG